MLLIAWLVLIVLFLLFNFYLLFYSGVCCARLFGVCVIGLCCRFCWWVLVVCLLFGFGVVGLFGYGVYYLDWLAGVIVV